MMKKHNNNENIHELSENSGWLYAGPTVHDAFVYFFSEINFFHTPVAPHCDFFNVPQELYNMLMSNTDYSTQNFYLIWFISLENSFILKFYTICRNSWCPFQENGKLCQV